MFLRHTDSGKCITTGELVFNDTSKAKPFSAVMNDNCLNTSAKFRYLDNELLLNIEKNGTLISSSQEKFKSLWVIYHGVSDYAKRYQNSLLHRLKQTNDGSLFFYHNNQLVCAEPKTTYIYRNTKCNTKEQEFTFGKSEIVYNLYSYFSIIRI